MADEDVTIPLKNVVFDILLLQIIIWPQIILYNFVTPVQRGFFCEDNSLRYPYVRSTVPGWVLHVVGFGANFVTMTLVEIINRSNTKTKIYMLGRNIPYVVYTIYCILGIFIFGAACSECFTGIIKFTVGRLRPYFHTVCQPSVNCSLHENHHVYHRDFTCTNPSYNHNKFMMKNIRLSFPSGHSSYSLYTMVYLTIYLQKRMTWRGSKLLKHILQCLALFFSIFTAMSRISDYKHHWSDVVGGLALGFIIAWLVARHLSTLYSTNGIDFGFNRPTATEI